MPTLLVVHHTPSPVMDTMRQAVLDGTEADGIAGVEVVRRPALTASAVDVLNADAVILGTPANLGYMSGALKHFFDTIYYPCLDATVGLGFGLYVHGDNDVDGAVNSVEKITTGLGWRLLQVPIRLAGPIDPDGRDACWELGASIAAGIST